MQLVPAGPGGADPTDRCVMGLRFPAFAETGFGLFKQVERRHCGMLSAARAQLQLKYT